MQLYRRKTLLSDKADFAFFTDQYSQAILSKSDEPFLLVRHDDSRLLVVTDHDRIMLCLAEPANCYSVSCATSYLDGTRTILGLSGEITAKDENFVDPHLAISAIKAFFDGSGVCQHVDFRRATTDPEIGLFPRKMRSLDDVEYEDVELEVTVTPELQADMREVCEFLDAAVNDSEMGLYANDALQIGALCDGRICGECIDQRRDIYLFSYYTNGGATWLFEVSRTVMDGIAERSLTKMTVSASIPKAEANNAGKPTE